MKKKLCVFDLDGTLLDTIGDLSQAVDHAMMVRGFPTHTREEYKMMVGDGVRNLVMRALPECHRDNQQMVDEALSDFKAYYTAHIDEYTQPYPGMPQLLTALHSKGVMLAVASNKFQEGTERLIRKFFPDIPFVAILGNRPGFPLKPDPEIVWEVMRKTGIGKDETLMVGDSPTDMNTAQNAGIEGVAVSWGYRRMTSEMGFTVVDSAAEIMEICEAK